LLHIVLMSGGSGSRLWPLSSGERTKAFLQLLTSPDGRKESMLQRVNRQLEAAGLLASMHIVTHTSLSGITYSQLGERTKIIEEPHRRGTLHAILLAAAYLKDRAGIAPDDYVCVLPVDLFADQDLFEIVSGMPELLRHSQSELGLIGAAPDHPSDQFGYIEPHPDSGERYAGIARFVEKPPADQARKLIEQGAMWNCGVFAFRLDTMLAKFRELQLPVDYDGLLAAYSELSEASFDREIAERIERAIVVPYRGRWRDLGTWSTLTERLDRQVTGLGSIDARSAGTHIVNELDIPIHVIACSNLIIAAGPNGILVADKDASHAIKELLHPKPSE
jgi:mannose-1-phosphate guanylyltransferase